MNPIELTRLNADRAWEAFASGSKWRQIEERSQLLPNQGRYYGFDALRGKHRVQLPDGSIINGDLLSSAGLSRGDRVTIAKDRSRVVFKSRVR